MSERREFLDCPACGDECEQIPCCEEAHPECNADLPDGLTRSWCEDRRGVCSCGARLYVSVDDGWASLEEEEGEEGQP
jgi:hypothetical protein